MKKTLQSKRKKTKIIFYTIRAAAALLIMSTLVAWFTIHKEAAEQKATEIAAYEKLNMLTNRILIETNKDSLSKFTDILYREFYEKLPVSPDNYDALMIPGGVMNPDKMRINKDCIAFADAFIQSGKPIAAICHGPQLLIETGFVKGKKMTSYLSLKTDLENAGATWYDKEVVTDNGLVTSRSPKDLEAFNKKMIEEILEGIHAVAQF